MMLGEKKKRGPEKDIINCLCILHTTVPEKKGRNKKEAPKGPWGEKKLVE